MPPPLTAAQRRAKFAAKPPEAGLRSKGFRRLGVDEQRALLAGLSREGTAARLHELRVLREAATSVKPPKDLELEIYVASAQEIIRQRKVDTLVPVLGALCEIAPDSIYQYLYVILLSNTSQFNEALRLCVKERDFVYVRSVLNKDFPVFKHLLATEEDAWARNLMEGARLDAYKESLAWVMKHPAKR